MAFGTAGTNSFTGNTNTAYTPLSVTQQTYQTQEDINRRPALWQLLIYNPSLITAPAKTTRTYASVNTNLTYNNFTALGLSTNPSRSNGNQNIIGYFSNTTPEKKGFIINTYIFPISPMNLKKNFVDLNTIYNVKGKAQNIHNSGVDRVIDQFGITPVTYTLSGTTGWKYHSNDGFAFTGLQSIINLQTIIRQYEYFRQLYNASNGKASQFNVILELYDHFNGEYWQVVPEGPQEFSMNSAKPLLSYYNLKLAGVKNVSAPSKFVSPLTNAFNTLKNTSSNISNQAQKLFSTVGATF